MTKKILAAAILSAAVFAVGCDNEEKAPAPAATSANPTPNSTANKAMDAAAGVKESAAAAQEKTAAAVNDAKANATDAGNGVVAEAQALFAQAQSAISSAKFDDAQKYVDQLKALRDKLPADWQAKVDELAKTLTDAKAKLGALPSMPSMPK